MVVVHLPRVDSDTVRGQRSAHPKRHRILGLTLLLCSMVEPHSAFAGEAESVWKSGGRDHPSPTQPRPPSTPEGSSSPSGDDVAVAILASAEEGAGLDDEFDIELDEQPVGFPDPLEPVNRGMLRFNIELDRWLLDPITRVYGFLLPKFARRAIRRMLLNINTPPVLVNDLLQLEWRDAGVTLSRFVINSSVGLAGLIEVAGPMGLERHDSDFGQTLCMAGVASGPYLVLPVFGPSTMRDGAGEIVDNLMRPATWFFAIASPPQLLYGGGAGISTREEHYQALTALRESSVDFYAALRSAYYQNRMAEIWGRREHRRPERANVYSITPLARSSALRSTLASSTSKPSRFSTDEYSERRNASSLTVPFR